MFLNVVYDVLSSIMLVMGNVFCRHIFNKVFRCCGIIRLRISKFEASLVVQCVDNS